uniref:Uncharacterized protein n=1 Tax=Biomphalaria glabrata TaxID=6526 RepID=A0A2C9L4G7_BIOGL
MEQINENLLGLNLSSNSENSQERDGHKEEQEFMCGEAANDLHTVCTFCSKDPNHSKFIPIDNFTIEHIPEESRRPDIYKIVKAIADLTVKISVSKLSPNRPKYWLNTDQLYPRFTGTGTGLMSEVFYFYRGLDEFKFRHEKDYTQCWCTKCQGSSSASLGWWEFIVYTATHVVFDEVEANNTAFRLFFDTQESPKVYLEFATVVDANVKTDMCILRGVTCDRNLGHKLKNLWSDYSFLMEMFQFEYSEASRDRDKLTFVVSHPHGRAKHVTVGHWQEKEDVKALMKFKYNTNTCPGSSGAMVFCLGYSWGSWYNQFVHSGSLNAELNHSALGGVYVDKECRNTADVEDEVTGM